MLDFVVIALPSRNKHGARQELPSRLNGEQLVET